MSCMYEYNQNPDGKGGFILGQITSIKSPVRGCAAGSVWEDDSNGRVILSSRTAESLGSVWRKVPSAAASAAPLLPPLPPLFLPPLLLLTDHPRRRPTCTGPSPHPPHPPSPTPPAPPQSSCHVAAAAGERVGAGVVRGRGGGAQGPPVGGELAPVARRPDPPLQGPRAAPVRPGAPPPNPPTPQSHTSPSTMAPIHQGTMTPALLPPLEAGEALAPRSAGASRPPVRRAMRPRLRGAGGGGGVAGAHARGGEAGGAGRGTGGRSASWSWGRGRTTWTRRTCPRRGPT